MIALTEENSKNYYQPIPTARGYKQRGCLDHLDLCYTQTEDNLSLGETALVLATWRLLNLWTVKKLSNF